MDSWHATFLGLRHLPREVSAFEIEAFYQFSAEECRVIEERRRPELKLALALQIGFLRMSGRLLEAVRIVPPLLWKHLGARFNVAAPDLASLRAMYRRAPTLIEHQQLACETLGFRWLERASSSLPRARDARGTHAHRRSAAPSRLCAALALRSSAHHWGYSNKGT